MPGSRAVSLWLPVVIWAAVIFTFSSIPSLGTGLGVWDTILRKGAHMTEYAILGLLLLRAVGSEAPAFLIGVGYAVGLAIGIFLVSRLFQTRPVPGTGQVP